jgi:hypothetical protein
VPTFSNIGLQEPSTITNRVAAVTIDRGGVTEQQEILVLGDSESSGAVARVLASAPPSTTYGLVVRVADPSTTVNVSSVSGVVSVSPVSTASVRVAQSTASDLQATVTPASSSWQVQVTNPSTTVQVSSLAGVVAVSPVSTASMRVAQSSAADLNVTVAGYSTTVNVSSLGGVVLTRLADRDQSTQVVAVLNATPASTTYAIAVREVAHSTGPFQVSSLAGKVLVDQNSTVWPVQVSSVAGTVTVRPSDTNWASSAGFHFDGSGNLNIAGSFSASTVTTISQLLDSSGGSVTVGDNVNQALRVNVVAGAAGGSTIVTVSTGSVRVHQSTAADLNVTVAGYSTTANVSSVAGRVLVDQNSTVWPVQVSSVAGIVLAQLADRDASTQVVAVLNAAPVSTTYGLVTRPVGYSTTVNVSSLAGKVLVDQNSTVWVAQVSSVAGVVTAQQNSTVWAVQLSNYSTTAQVSSLAGRVLVDQNSTVWVVQVSSLAGAIVARMSDGAGNALESSTSAPSTGARGLFVRPVLGGLTSYSASTTGQSSLTTIVSSAAASKAFIYAYSITSTLGGPVEWGIYSGSTRLWGGVLAATSSAISGVNLAVTPPGYLVSGSTGQALTFNVASSHTGMNVSIAYWQST